MHALHIEWWTPAGLVFTLVGIVVGLLPPTVVTADYSYGKEDQRRQRRRYWISVGLVCFGTALQLFPSLPQRAQECLIALVNTAIVF